MWYIFNIIFFNESQTNIDTNKYLNSYFQFLNFSNKIGENKFGVIKILNNLFCYDFLNN